MIRRRTRAAGGLAYAVVIAALASCASPRGDDRALASGGSSPLPREHDSLRKVHGHRGMNHFPGTKSTEDPDGASQRIDRSNSAASEAPVLPAPADEGQPVGKVSNSERESGKESPPVVEAPGKAEPPSCHSGEGTGSAPAAQGLLVDLELGFCPVTGEPADGKTYAEWKGVRVGLCRPACLDVFHASTEAYLDKAAPEWREAVAAEQVVIAAKTQEERELAMEDLSRWTIVRKLPPIPSTGLLVDLENDYCPVLLEDIHGRDFVDWNGLRVHLCCTPCVSGFWPRPGLVLEHAKIGWREAAAAVKAVNESRGADREKALLKLRSEWKVLREPVPPAETPAPPSK